MKNKVLFLLIVGMSLAQNAMAYYNFSAVAPTGQTLYYSISGNKAIVTAPGFYNDWGSYTKPSGKLIIPDSVTNKGITYPVNSIGEYAFGGCIDLTSVTIPSTVTSIGKYAFTSCSGIATLSIPSSVVSIGIGAFYKVGHIEYYGFASGRPWGAKTVNEVHKVVVKKQFQDYFRDHISELDPIEGEWNTTITIVSDDINGRKQDKRNGRITILRDKTHSNSFISIGDDGTKKDDVFFKKIGETNVYSFYSTEIQEEPLCNVYIESLFQIIYDFFLPDYYIRNTINKNPNYVKIHTYFEMIKEYPTRSMYEKAISQGNSSHNEASSWSGTGYAISSNYIVTNDHVIDGAKTIKIKGINGNYSTSYSAEVVSRDKKNDLAILRINDSRFGSITAIPYSIKTQQLEVGDEVYVLGYPLTQALGDEIKLTNGIISSRTGYQNDVSTYQMSAPVQPGNSGGPMFDSKGNVVGIVNAGVPGAENVGYAIKTSYLKNLIESAGLNITLPSNNTISSLSLSEKVKRLKKFVYYIECSK